MTRRDLPLGAQLAQATHAAIDWQWAQPELARKWHQESNTIVILTAADEAELQQLASTAPGPCVQFREPDLQNQLTAIALSQEAKAALRHLPLAMRCPNTSS